MFKKKKKRVYDAIVVVIFEYASYETLYYGMICLVYFETLE